MPYVRVAEVKEVTTALLKIRPPALAVHAVGVVNSSGWTEPQLTAWVYIQPPADGILDLDFIAKRPTGIVHWTLMPIGGDVVIENVDLANYWGSGLPLNGVRVHAAANVFVATPSSTVQANAVNLRNGDRWPW